MRCINTSLKFIDILATKLYEGGMSIEELNRETKRLQQQRKKISHWKASQLIDIDMEIRNLERKLRKVRSNLSLI